MVMQPGRYQISFSQLGQSRLTAMIPYPPQFEQPCHPYSLLGGLPLHLGQIFVSAVDGVPVDFLDKVIIFLSVYVTSGGCPSECLSAVA